ncbi:MAG: hypothetical protein PHQ04_11620 [Opitutaceae bacterium]|nr:hypothetical protein [Opitutaceae bacterium]
MKKTAAGRPFAIDLALPLLQRLSVAQRRLKKRSVSDLIREALSEFDAEAYEPSHPPHLQISVRLPASQRKALKRAGRVRKVSTGELVRAAVEGYLLRHPLSPPPAPVKSKPSPRPSARIRRRKIK